MSFSPTPSTALRQAWPAILAVVVGCAMSAAWVAYQRLAHHALEQERLAQASKNWAAALEQRLAAQTGALMGMRDLHQREGLKDQGSFAQAIEARGAAKIFPEIRHWSSVAWLPGTEPHPLSSDSGGASDTGERHVVAVTWPMAAGEAIEAPAIRQLLQTLRGSSRPTISEPYALGARAAHCTGYALGIPVFSGHRHQGGGSPEFQGALLAEVCAEDLLRAVQWPGSLRALGLRLEDLGAGTSGGMSPHLLAEFPATDAAEAAAGADRPSEPLPVAVQQLEAHGRHWRMTLKGQGQASLLSALEQGLPWWQGGAGLLATLLLASWMLFRRRRKAQGGDYSKALFEQAAVGMAQIDTQSGRFVRVNPKYARNLAANHIPRLECAE
jgi:hypothetical protein